MTKIANYFLTSKSENLAQIVQALTALNNEPSPLSKPVSFIRVSDFPKTTLSMVDVFGQKVESARFLVGVDNGDLEEVGSDGVFDASGLRVGCVVSEASDLARKDPEITNLTLFSRPPTRHPYHRNPNFRIWLLRRHRRSQTTQI